MLKVKRFLFSQRVFFGLFFFLLAYEALVGNNLAPWRVNDHFITFYTVDFGLGFCSRFLPGAVYRLLFRTLNRTVLSAVCILLTVLFFAAVCLLLEKLYSRAGENERPVCLFFFLLLITGPASFSLFVKWLGVIDFYWVLLCPLFVLALSSPRTYFLIPPLFVLLILVHYGAMICYVPMMAILLLYRFVTAEEKRERRALAAVLLVSVCAAAGLTVYFILFERRNLPYSMEEFNAILLERGAKYTYYYDYNIYRNLSSAGDQSVEGFIYGAGDPLITIARSVWMQVKTTLALRFKAGLTLEYVLSLLLTAPAAGVIISVFVARFRAEKGAAFLKRAVYLLAPLVFAGGFIASTLFSSDTFRWVTHTFLPLITVFLYMAYREGEDFWNAARRKLSAVPVPASAVYLIAYAAIVAAE